MEMAFGQQAEEIQQYIKDIRKIKVISHDRQDEIFKQLKRKDITKVEKQKLLDELVVGNLRFVITVAKLYQGQGMDIMDLISELIYSIKAISNNHSSTKEIILCYTSDQEGGIVDIRMSVCNCDSFFQQLKHLYAKQMQVEKLKGFRIYGVPSSNLSNYRFTKH